MCAISQQQQHSKQKQYRASSKTDVSSNPQLQFFGDCGVFDSINFQNIFKLCHSLTFWYFFHIVIILSNMNIKKLQTFMCFENMSLINIRQQCPAPSRFIERSSKLIKNLPNVPKLETFAYITNITANTWSINKIVVQRPPDRTIYRSADLC